MTKPAQNPALRFKNKGGKPFPDWEEKKLGEIAIKKASTISQNTLDDKAGKYPIYGAPGIIKYINFYEEKEQYVAVVKDGAGVGRTFLCHAKSSTLGTLDGIFPRKNNLIKFIYYLLSQIDFKKFVIGSTIPHVYFRDYSRVVLPLPHPDEQKKIADFLTAMDDKIDALTRKRDLLEDYKRGLMQLLFSQKLRFKNKNGNPFPDWEKKQLDAVFHEHKKKSDGTEQVFSVSVHKGLINQIEHLGRSYAAKNTSNYNVVEPNDIIYTKSPTGKFPLGIIKQSRLKDNVIVSPLYGVFKPETQWLGYLLHAYFESEINTENYLKPIIQKGAKNTINITNQTFLTNTLTLPVDKDEQKKIADFLTAIDDKIDALTRQRDQMETYKRALMQKMFV